MSVRTVTSLVAVTLLFAASPGAHAAWSPPGIDLARPRIPFRDGDVPALQAKVEREPYRGILKDLRRRASAADGIALDDHAIDSERQKARSAKDLAFLYAIDRTVVGRDVVPFATPADRAAVSRRVHDLLLAMYTRHRIAVPPPLGGWDRDISSSEELLQYATAYDTMLGAGWDFGADRAAIEENIVDLASEMYENYRDPDTVGGATRLHQNNHRAKSGAAMALAAIAVAEYTPPPGSDPRGVRDPALWLEYGLDQVDLVMRHALVTGDGAYGEGPFYLRYASQNLIPFLRAWDRLVDGADWPARGVVVPSLWRHPLWLRTQRWMLDMTLPDGSMAPIDDGNPGRSHYFGILPPTPWSGAFAWRWTNAPQPLDTDGNVDLAADAIVLFDDGVVAAPPDGSPTSFWFDGGNAIFRSDWSTDAVVANVQAEHDTASEFGRDRDGRGVSPQSHENAEPGAFLMHAFGERLALDPGYLSFSEHGLVNKPEHHNLILVDGKGPVDYLTASFGWQVDLAGPPPADGQAFLSDAIDGRFADAATVRTSYGLAPARRTDIERRFVFADDRYLAIFDHVASPGDTPRTFTWLLHGNGGGTSGGTFEKTPAGGRWTRPQARLDSGIAIAGGTPAFAVSTGQHEVPDRVLTTHTVLAANATGDDVRAVQLLHPTRTGDAPPAIETVATNAGNALLLTDPAGDRRVLALHRAPAAPTLAAAPPGSGLAPVATDGSRVLIDAHADGRLWLAWSEDATSLRYDGVELLRGTRPAVLGIALGAGRAEVVVDDGSDETTVRGLAFTPTAADGACTMSVSAGAATLGLSRERRVTLRADGGNSAPGADPGPDRFVPQGARVPLDASASCDLDGDALIASWELVEAPIGADWTLDDADGPLPSLLASDRGTYRLRLTVSDAHGAASLPHDLVIRAVAPEEDPDGDLVPADLDNCGAVANPDQRDAAPAGGNGVGDACECTDGSCVAGGGSGDFDCAFEIRALDAPAEGPRRVACRDGAPCDSDPAPGSCGFDVQLCLANRDTARATCTSFAPDTVRLTNWTAGGTPTILGALAALPGGRVSGPRTVVFEPPLAATDACTAPLRLTVPVPGRSLVVRTSGAGGRDADRVRFVCTR